MAGRNDREYHRCFRPSIVPQTKCDRWIESCNLRKNERQGKIISSYSGSSVPQLTTFKKPNEKAVLSRVTEEGRKFNNNVAAKKPPFIVPGIIRPNDIFLHSKPVLKKNPFLGIPASTSGFQPKKTTMPTTVPSFKIKPPVSYKNGSKEVLTSDNAAAFQCSNKAKYLATAVSQKKEWPASKIATVTPFIPPKGLKVCPQSILKKSPAATEIRSLKLPCDGQDFDNPWITSSRGCSSQAAFRDLGSHCPPLPSKVSFVLEDSPVKNLPQISEDFESSKNNSTFSNTERDSAANTSNKSESVIEGMLETNAGDLVRIKLSCGPSDMEGSRKIQEKSEDKKDGSKDSSSCTRSDDEDVSSESSIESNQIECVDLSNEDDESTEKFTENPTSSEIVKEKGVSTTDFTTSYLDSETSSSSDDSADLSQIALRLRERLREENTSLESACTFWENELEGDNVPDEEKGNVLTVVRQSQQLQRERFSQYADLIDQFENKSADKEILTNDMEGFWEMIHLQVVDLKKKFAELDSLKQENWIRAEATDEQISSERKKKINSRPRVLGFKSSIRSHIAAARKKLNSTSSPLPACEFPARATPLYRTPVDLRFSAKALLLAPSEYGGAASPSSPNDETVFEQSIVGRRKKHKSECEMNSTGKKRTVLQRKRSTTDPLFLDSLTAVRSGTPKCGIKLENSQRMWVEGVSPIRLNPTPPNNNRMKGGNCPLGKSPLSPKLPHIKLNSSTPIQAKAHRLGPPFESPCQELTFESTTIQDGNQNEPNESQEY